VLHDQAVLGVLALGHIHHRSEVLDQLSRLVENRMPNRVQVPDRSIGQHDPVPLLVFGFVAEYLRELREHALAVLRVNQLAGLFELRRPAVAAGIQSKQTERLIRVVLHLPKRVIVGPAPGVRKPLRFGEIRLTLP
jgi:hypothetical protein